MAIARSILNLVGRKPSALIVPAAFVGFGVGMAPGMGDATSSFMETVTGDRNAIRNVARAQLRSTYEEIVNTPAERNVMEYLTRSYSRTPSNSLYGPGGGPSGSVVFGMYNLRAK